MGSTKIELVEILRSRNVNNRYDELIQLASDGQYHDFESEHVTPKMALAEDLANFPELHDVREMVKSGEFDES